MNEKDNKSRESEELLSGAKSSASVVGGAQDVEQTTTPSVEKIAKDLRKTIDQMAKTFDSRIEEKETKTTEILAIFITLFTFISVSVNIFTKVGDLHTAAWFLILMTSCSLLILSSMFLLISNRRNWYSIGILLISLIFMWGLFFATRLIPNFDTRLNNVSTL